MSNELLIILGNQLFPLDNIRKSGCNNVFMAEDMELCTYVKHHKQKIAFFLTAMRNYRDELISNEYTVLYQQLDDNLENLTYLEKLDKVITDKQISEVKFFDIPDKLFRNKILSYLEKNKIKYTILNSPMFLLVDNEYDELLTSKKLFMASFYQKMRKKFNILIDDNNKPIGGKWSFDEENRKKLPKEIKINELPGISVSKNSSDIQKLVTNLFNNHPGILKKLWIPTTRKDAKKWFKDFLVSRFQKFGDYEDAIDTDETFLFHSVLSPLMNIGLLLPNEVLKESLEFAKDNSIPLNSLEGFIRQVLGWREFIRVVYELKSDDQEKSNFFKNKRKLSPSWYDATTGIPPLDKAITDCLVYGYTHHINRLMIISNLMNLCRIKPLEIYNWFMEMSIDSSDWVMVPNVYGMSTYADGGLMSTKPYICGSNYILKMSNFKKGEWCDILDGLYWKFIDDHREFFNSNPRLSLVTRSLDRMKNERKEKIFFSAKKFIEKHTI